MLRTIIHLIAFTIFGLNLSQAQSIFDVYRDSSEVLESKPVPQPQSINDVILDDLENPFEVSHIPIRKNQEIKSVQKKSRTSRISAPSTNSAISPLSIILISALGLGIILFNARGIIKDLIQSLTNSNYMQSYRIKMLSSFLPHSMGLYIIFFLNLSLFIVLSYKSLSVASTTLPLLYILISIPIIYLVRHIMLYLMGWVYELENETGSFSFVIASINFILGLILIPINLFVAFSPPELGKIFVFIGILLIALAVGYRYFRGFFIASRYVLGATFQFFLYFCTFEIAPVLIILNYLGVI